MSMFARAAGTLRWLAWAGCLAAATLHAQSLEVIDLTHRTAPEVIPVLQPLPEPGGAISGQDYKLFVRASPANLAQLRAALARIDRAPRQLLVSVRRGMRSEMEREDVSVAGTVRSGDAAISINERPRDGSGARVQAGAAATRRQTDGISSVRVLEGYSASVSTGTSRSLPPLRRAAPAPPATRAPSNTAPSAVGFWWRRVSAAERRSGYRAAARTASTRHHRHAKSRDADQRPAG